MWSYRPAKATVLEGGAFGGGARGAMKSLDDESQIRVDSEEISLDILWDVLWSNAGPDGKGSSLKGALMMRKGEYEE